MQMTNKIVKTALVAFLMTGTGANAATAEVNVNKEINDNTTPLHLLQPDYKVPYGALKAADVKAVMDRVFHYIDSLTPAKVLDKEGKELKRKAKLKPGSHIYQGKFRLTSYEWGVTYQALLDAARLTGDRRYADYVKDRLCFLSDVAPEFGKLLDAGYKENQMRQVARPANLDDAGAMGSAMMRADLEFPDIDLKECANRYYDILENKTHRLDDGTIARTRPHVDAVWLDDMYMAIPAMATRSRYMNDPKYMEEAARITSQFIDRMWVPEKKLFRHGYVEGLKEQPTFHWGRANGWAILTMSQLLDVLPESSPYRPKIMATFRNHVKGLVERQSKDGFWHQLLDRPDSYYETSATAIFTYCLAHAINQGWIDAVTYGPAVTLAWNALTTEITYEGAVENVCVGTGMGFDPAFYYYRPVTSAAAHGYGPVLWAGAEMVKLLNDTYPYNNDSAVHFYLTDPEAMTPIFYLDRKGKAAEVLH